MKKLMILVAAAAASMIGFAAAKAPAPFAANERVTFFGDSITTHNYFTYQLELIDVLRNPGAGMHTISRGHAGDTAHGGFARWDWDAATTPSDRVFVMFGMNDIGRGNWMDEKPSAEIAAKRKAALDKYADYSRKLADKILASGRKLVMVTPSPYDQYGKQEAENIPFCNDPGLAGCAEIVRKLADEKNLEMVDFHKPLSAFLQEHPCFGLLAKDRVHPDNAGGLLMAVVILEQMGVLPYTDETTFEAKGAATFDYTPKHLPYPRTSEYKKLNGTYALDGHLTREIVKVTGLPKGYYELSGNGQAFGTFTAEELAKGVDLATLDTPSMKQAMAAYKVWATMRGKVQYARRLVSTECEIRNYGGDPADAESAKAAIAKRRALINKDPKARHYGYSMGQLDFYEKNASKKQEMWQEIDDFETKLRQAVRPKSWKLSVKPVADVKPFAAWPERCDPKTVSQKLTKLLLSTDPECYRPKGYDSPSGYCRKGYTGRPVHYSVVSLWVNALECARLTGDKATEKKLVDLFAPYYGEKQDKLPKFKHVDFTIVGSIPLEIAVLTGDKRATELGLHFADMQWEEPKPNDPPPPYNVMTIEERLGWWKKGYTCQTRLWIDDMYMINVLQGLAYRLTGDRKYIDRAAKEMCLYLDEIQLKDGKDAGMFYHAPDVPYIWGRGAGWMAAGMPIILEYLPKDSEYREKIMKGYLAMMKALYQRQRPNGMWNQLVGDPKSWEETSATAMYGFGFAMGVKNGWLDKATYGLAARKAYLAVLERTDADGNVRDVCCGTGKRNDYQYYLDRPHVHGDPHGQCALMWMCRVFLEQAK